MNPAEASTKYHWVKYDPETMTVDLFMDHQMLSTLRMCEHKFVYEHIFNIRPKGHKAWSLMFGAWMHFCFETYYKHLCHNDGKAIDIAAWLQYSRAKWLELNLDAYKDEEKYKDISGYDGASALLVSYYAYYDGLRLRVVATEVSFGTNREVYLGSFSYGPFTVRCFLTGRIDLLVDNGHKIGPVDHKHTHVFRGDEWTKYNPHDGITGYIFATNEIIKNMFPDYKTTCNSGWIFHIQGKAPSISRKTKQVHERFKASTVDKTLAHLEEYASRQVSTFRRAYELLFNYKTPEMTTTACHNIYNRKCEYLPIDEQDNNNKDYIIKQFYNITTPWNPQSPEQSLIVRDDVLSYTGETKDAIIT